MQTEKNGVDVLDSSGAPKIDTNPFTNNAVPSSSNSANPFSCYMEPLEDPEPADGDKTEGEQYFQEGSLVKGIVVTTILKIFYRFIFISLFYQYDGLYNQINGLSFISDVISIC